LFLTLLAAGFTVVVAPPQFARQIKGRPKTDRRDCQWIQRLHKHGLLPAVFQPDEATHTLRDYVRQRANLVRLSGQHIQRMQKALELMNLKLTKVLGDVTGVTGLKIIRAIVAGVRGRKPHDPRFDVRTALYYLMGVDLTAIEGIDELHALTLVSERGTDFTKWPTVKHFTSWLGLCPNWKKTGGKVKSSQTRQGKNRAAGALRLAAWSLMRSKSYLGAYLRRQRSRLGAPKAITAAAHRLARIA